jgi:Large polyvalent protein-associated domain 7
MTTQQEAPVEQQEEGGKKARRPAYGVLVDHGQAPYKHDPNQSQSYYARLKGANGREFDVWGKEIQAALTESKIEVGQNIKLSHMGSRPVTVHEPVLDAEGKHIGSSEKSSHVNQWMAEVVPERRQAQGRNKAADKAAETTSPALGGQLQPSPTPARDVTQRAEPIEKDMHTHANLVDPALAGSFAQTENAYARVGRGNLDKARQAGIELNIDTAEQLDTRLGRAEDGHMESRYLENSYNGPAAGRTSLQDYVGTLRKEAQQHSVTNPALAARYEAQVKFELASQDGRINSTGKRAEYAASQMDEANADLAKADLAGRSSHMTTAEARLEQTAPQSKSEWIRHTYNLSDLRASLEPGAQSDYDHYRGVVTRELAKQQGKDPQTYAMSGREVMAFDSAFVAYNDSKYRGIHLAETRVTAQTQAATSEIHGTRKPEEAALDKVPQPVQVNGFESRRADDGRTLEYSAKGQQAVAFRDTGDRVAVRSGDQASTDVLRGALTVAAQKFERISLNGSKEFRENAAREAVRMGMGERIGNRDLQSIMADERAKMELGQQQGAERGQAAQQEPLTVQMAQVQATAQEQAGQDLRVQKQAPEAATAREGAGHQQATPMLAVKLMAESSNQGRTQAGDARLPVAVMSKPGDKGRVAGSEQLPVSIQDDASLTAERSPSEAVTR